MSTGPNIPGFVQPFTLNVVQATQPSFTSAATATALVGNPFSFTVTTSGPTPALTESGDLPPTFTFTDNGDGTATIAGNPPADADVGQYNPVTITATNAEGTATQSFTLTVKPPLAIHGPTSFTAADGVFFDVEPLAGGFMPFPSLTELGELPSGVTFVDNGFGDADIEGSTSQDGVYPITVTAHDGIERDATEIFTLTVAPPSPAAFTSAASTAVEVDTPFSFNVTTTGAPTSTISASSLSSNQFQPPPPFPDGVNFTDNVDGTATLSGTVETPGTYQALLTADPLQVDGQSTSQLFTLTVLQPAPSCVAPACDSAVGTDPDGSVQVASGGPNGLAATANGIGGLTVGQYTEDPLSSPAIGATGAYFDVADSSDNAFTSLTLDDCDLMSGNVVQWWNPGANDGAGAWETVSDQTYLPGTPDCVEVDISPSTSPSLSDLTGTVFAVGSINQVPSVTSATTTTANVGQPMTFNVTTAGFPTPALTLTGNTARGGHLRRQRRRHGHALGYPERNGQDLHAQDHRQEHGRQRQPRASRSVVHQAPAITSAATATFTTGKTGTFKITTSGLSGRGAEHRTARCPTGVTFVENGNGTATLSGTPEDGTSGSLPADDHRDQRRPGP